MSEDDDRWVGQWSLQLVETLRACQGICRTLAEDALDAEAEGRRPLTDSAVREKLEQLLDRLGEPL